LQRLSTKGGTLQRYMAKENRQHVVCDYIYDNYVQFMTTAEISDKLVIKGSIKRPMPLNRLGMVLKKAGYKSKMYGAARTRGWIVRELSAEEVNANRNIEGHT